MAVIYDLLAVQNRDNAERGIARYVLNLALGLERVSPGLVDQFLIHPDLPLPAGVEPLIATGRMVRADQDSPLRRPSAGGVFIAGSLFEMHEPLDRVFPVWARSPQWQTVAVLYDLIPCRYAARYLANEEIRHRYWARTSALSAFDHLLAISQASANDATELLGIEPGRITVIGAGADDRFRPLSTAGNAVADGSVGTRADNNAMALDLVGSATIPDLKPHYLLFPSGIEWRKNIDRTVEAYGQLPANVRARHQLVIVARVDDDARRTLAELTARHRVSNNVILTDFVTDDTLVKLYQRAEAVIFPSLYEGFGLPVLEAMQCGAPVICSDSSSLREVQLREEARFNPEDVGAMAEAMANVLGNATFRDRLRAQEPPPFTWDLAAELTAEVVTDRQRSLPAAGRAAKPRLALLSPLPPQRSGIATYAYRLLEHLRHHCDVTVFVDLAVGNADADAFDVNAVVAPEGVIVEPISRLDAVVSDGGAFDRYLYFMGNSTFHVEMMHALERHPGYVLSHDARLTGLYSEIQRLAPERLVECSVGATLARAYPNRYRSEVEADKVIGPDTAQRFGICLTREMTSKAQKVLVHSEHAAALLNFDAAVRSASEVGFEAEVVFAIPCPTVSEQDRRGTGPMATAPPVISTFGLVAPPKQPELLIEAFAKLDNPAPGTTLAFVGDIDPAYQKELTARAVTAGVESSVRFVGHLDDEGFREAQGQTTVALQLRAYSNGESSAAVADLLSLGIPTVVTAIGAMAEYPPGVVASVGPDVSADGLAAALDGLLADETRRQQLSESALGYAQANDFAQAAKTLAATLFD